MVMVLIKKMSLILFIILLATLKEKCQAVDEKHLLSTLATIYNLYEGTNQIPVLKLYNYKGSEVIELNNSSDLGLNLKIPTYFYIHGWMQNASNGLAAENLDKHNPCNFIKVDYNTFFNNISSYGPTTVQSVGTLLGNFIIDAHNANQIDINSVTFIGLSFGCHVCGYAGKTIYNKLNMQIARITALDPSGLLFALPFKIYPQYALNAKAAKCVDVLHTTANVLGTFERLGTVDIYAMPIYTPQYCCEDDLTPVYCSHLVALDYYIESISSCAMRMKTIFGKSTNIPFGYHMPVNTKGLYTFYPNKMAPYGKGNPVC